jgi:hypothetical protein
MNPVDTPPPESPATPEPKPASLRQVAGAVFWSFFGVRKGKDMQSDAVSIKPLHLVIVALLSGLVFVLALVGLVSLITRKV